MTQPLLKLLDKDIISVIGLMSGTSCDGLDIALVDISGHGLETRFTFRIGMSIPYSEEQKKAILGVIRQPRHSLKSLSQLNFYLADLWSEMIQNFFHSTGVHSENIDLIGSHGQTIWHEPVPDEFLDRSISSTWQIGDPSVLANKLDLPVVGDFRIADVALGGQGAPLIPYFDWLYFSKFRKNMLVINIGGISNMTFVPADGAFTSVKAFDTGPGNMLIDQAARILYDIDFDKDGIYAGRGTVDPGLFSFLQEQDPFPASAPPKSTGREYYGSRFLDPLLGYARQHHISHEDIMATLTKYTAFTIYLNYQKFIESENTVETVAVGGGGAHNPVLMNHLKTYFKDNDLLPVSHFEIDEDYKEAIGFAILANETLHGSPSNVPQVTGSSRPAILGKVCLV